MKISLSSGRGTPMANTYVSEHTIDNTDAPRRRLPRIRHRRYSAVTTAGSVHVLTLSPLKSEAGSGEDRTRHSLRQRFKERLDALEQLDRITGYA